MTYWALMDPAVDEHMTEVYPETSALVAQPLPDASTKDAPALD